MLTVIVGLVGSGKSRTRRPLASRYSVMPSTDVTLPGAAGAAAAAAGGLALAAGFGGGALVWAASEALHTAAKRKARNLWTACSRCIEGPPLRESRTASRDAGKAATHTTVGRFPADPGADGLRTDREALHERRGSRQVLARPALLGSRPRRLQAGSRDPVGGLVRRGVRPRAGGEAAGDPGPRRGVVPLVPRHGGDDVPGSRGDPADPRTLRGAARGSGLAARSLQPLRGLRLAGDHHLRRERARARQVRGIHPTGTHADAARGRRRRSDAGPLGTARRAASDLGGVARRALSGAAKGPRRAARAALRQGS